MAPKHQSLSLSTFKLLPAFALVTALANPRFAVSAEPASAQGNSAAEQQEWSGMAEILARIVPPIFPARKFAVTSYGAVGDGATDCTTAFENAIEACHQAGGGRVVVPAGVFLTGAIHLQSNVNLHLEKGAIVRFSTDPKMFLPVVFTRNECIEVMNYSPFVYALDQTNIAITGEGTLDGQASHAIWYSWKSSSDSKKLADMGDQNVPVAQRIFGEGHHLRPCFVEPVRCQNVLIEGVHIIDSPMWVLHPLYSTNITVQDVTVETKGPNTDGCDPDSCTDVLIKDCSFSDGDDCIAIKSGRDADGRRINIPCQNLVIQNCTFKDGHGGIALGSETSGGIRNVFAENCVFDSLNLDSALRFKTNPARGGFIEDVHIRKCSIKTARVGIHMTMRYASSGSRDGSSIPVVHNIDIRNCNFDALTKQPIFIEGWSESAPITDVTIANCNFSEAPGFSFITNASRIDLTGSHGTGLE
jgi:polygalacturonase